MNMFEELKAWADKWKIPYGIRSNGITTEIYFISASPVDACFSINNISGEGAWYGGD